VRLASGLATARAGCLVSLIVSHLFGVRSAPNFPPLVRLTNRIPDSLLLIATHYMLRDRFRRHAHYPWFQGAVKDAYCHADRAS
jgi:hypothetical protein